MRKILLSIFALATVALTANAQLLRAPKAVLAPASNSTRSSIEAQENQTWWSFYGGKGVQDSGIGTGAATTFDCAIKVAKDLGFSGKTIKAIRFYMLTNNVTNVSVWVSRELPSSGAEADVYTQPVEVSTLSTGNANPNDVALNTPVTLDDKDVYVGFSFKVKSKTGDADAYPVAVSNAKEVPDAFYLHTPTIAWGDLYSYGFGCLALEVLLEGEFAQNAVALGTVKNPIVKVGGSKNVAIPFVSQGSGAVNSISYTTTYEGVTSAEATAAVSPAVKGLGASGTFTINIPADKEVGSKPFRVDVTKVNSVANENAAGASTTFKLLSVQNLPARRTVVEEFTGTACGWCPRGLMGMQLLAELRPESFIGIGLHQYNSSDPMYFTDYSLDFSGAPSSFANRNGVEIDPYYGANNRARGIIDYVDALNAEGTIVDVNVEASYNADSTMVEANASIADVVGSGENYEVAFVLTADSLTGTSSSWRQSNFYSSYTPEEVGDEDLFIFAQGGTFGSNYFSWYFEDVAVGSSYVSGENTADMTGALNDTKAVNVAYSLKMPTKAVLKSAINKSMVDVVVLVLDNDGQVLNAAKGRVKAYNATGISTVSDSGRDAEVARFDLSGRRIATPQKGINLVKSSDGSIRKVMVK